MITKCRWSDAGVPGPPGARLEVIEPGRALRLLDGFFDVRAAISVPAR
jgi:hypothetical protein